MANKPTPADLMRQAIETSQEYFGAAIRIIDAIEDLKSSSCFQEMRSLPVAKDRKSIVPVSGNVVTKCSCRIDDPFEHSLANNWVKAWLADHPKHTRSEHVLVVAVFEWVEQRLEVGDA